MSASRWFWSVGLSLVCVTSEAPAESDVAAQRPPRQASGEQARSALGEQARSALARATDYLRTLSTEGGYLWRYSPDLTMRLGEKIASPTQIWVEPPGTPAIGQAFLRAYAVTRDLRYLEAARSAALALVRGQLASGGWDRVIEFDPAKRAGWAYRTEASTAADASNVSTYDDDNTQSALRFLAAFSDAAKSKPHARDKSIREALDYGLRKLIEAQYPNGGWPQRWSGTAHDAAKHPVQKASYPADYPREQPDGSYIGHYTLNDDAQSDVIRTLLDAHRRSGRAEYLKAAQRGGDFLLLAQMPEPQPAWAQQYDAAMHPAWARAFEPPSISSRESADAINLLVDLYLETGHKRYIEPLPATIAWFRRSALAPELWSRLYELQTNRPIYGDRDKRIHYTLEEISEERRTGYAWQRSFGIPATIERAEAVIKAGREKWLAQNGPSAPHSTSKPARAELERKVGEIIAALDEHGRWVTPAGGKKHEGLDGPWVEMSVFDANLKALCDYLEVTK